MIDPSVTCCGELPQFPTIGAPLDPRNGGDQDP
jgi:hypothetical protein